MVEFEQTFADRAIVVTLSRRERVSDEVDVLWADGRDMVGAEACEDMPQQQEIADTWNEWVANSSVLYLTDLAEPRG